MSKYIIVFLNNIRCETEIFNVVAEDRKEAERLFYLKYDRSIYGDCIEHIQIVFDNHFYTEEEILFESNVVNA